MAKGQAQAAENQLDLTNQIGSQYGKRAEGLSNVLTPAYTSMLNQGYTPGQESSMTTSGMGAIGSSFGAANQEAKNAAAKSGNASNLTGQEDQLAMESGLAKGQEAAGLQQTFADRQQANQQAGLAGLEGLYGENQNSANQMYGLSPSILQARAAGGPPAALGLIESAMGATGAAMSGKH